MSFKYEALRDERRGKPKESGFIGRYICSRNDTIVIFGSMESLRPVFYRRHGKGLDADVTYY